MKLSPTDHLGELYARQKIPNSIKFMDNINNNKKDNLISKFERFIKLLNTRMRKLFFLFFLILEEFRMFNFI